MKKYNFLAFDIGATSGRAVLGTLVGDKFEMQELHRFPNAIMELHGKYYWDIYRNEYLAQFLGLFIYGAVNYMMNKKITFQLTP